MNFTQETKKTNIKKEQFPLFFDATLVLVLTNYHFILTIKNKL